MESFKKNLKIPTSSNSTSSHSLAHLIQGYSPYLTVTDTNGNSVVDSQQRPRLYRSSINLSVLTRPVKRNPTSFAVAFALGSSDIGKSNKPPSIESSDQRSSRRDDVNATRSNQSLPSVTVNTDQDLDELPSITDQDQQLTRPCIVEIPPTPTGPSPAGSEAPAPSPPPSSSHHPFLHHQRSTPKTPNLDRLQVHDINRRSSAFPQSTTSTGCNDVECEPSLISRIRRVSLLLLSRQQSQDDRSDLDVSTTAAGSKTATRVEQTQSTALQSKLKMNIRQSSQPIPKPTSSQPLRAKTRKVISAGSASLANHDNDRLLNDDQSTNWSLFGRRPLFPSSRPFGRRQSSRSPEDEHLLAVPSSSESVKHSNSPPTVTASNEVSFRLLTEPKDHHHHRSRSRRCNTDRFTKGIGYHLGRRRRLLERRRRLADFSLAFGLFGIIAAVLDTELVSRRVYQNNDPYSNGMRVLISLSTLVLLALIISYHIYDVMIFLCEEYIKDWRILVTRGRVVQIIIELLICSIHPVPFGINLLVDMQAKPINLRNSSTTATTTHHGWRQPHVRLHNEMSPYLLLTIPMIGRMYLALRALLLHSRMFNDAGSRSIGAMNKVHFDLRLVLKTLMTLCPARTLLIFILAIWITLSWMLRACELDYYGGEHLGIIDSAWLISVTFLSIGYGDIVPHTGCGRFVAVTTGLMGSACTALLVAVFSKKLEMTKAEKHVIHFMESNKITKRVENCAANVLRESWLLYKYAKLTPIYSNHQVRLHQRKFLRAIYSLRNAKSKQREIKDKSNSLVDLAKLQTDVFEGVADISLRQDSFTSRLELIETHLCEIRMLILEQHRPASFNHNTTDSTNQRTATFVETR